MIIKKNFTEHLEVQKNTIETLENKILNYLEEHLDEIEKDMNRRNSTSKRKDKINKKTRKKREELSISASKSIKKEKVEIMVRFN